ncbi:MAG TPA: 23S rRNA (adenine(2030)-N(6))-methyltransferase RlmJ [Candidatus Limnocylindria bacterium]|nr:23S rRNA (adenine(2030)-N(6))-methyltransferase RlmJ [Candidatus Limnocylindria bacterium]
MPTHPSRYRPDAEPDYSHRFHAGNVGDVWKHCALVALLDRLAASGRRTAFLDTHAGEGRYRLGPTGEWTEGIGRLWSASGEDDGAVARYLAVCRSLVPASDRPRWYPGSPRFARAALGADAPLLLWERDPAACERLRADTAGDPRVRVVCGDGLAGLAASTAAAEANADAVLVLIDPPYVQKAEWMEVTDALAAAARRTRSACLALWYPVKSLTRPNAMMARLEAAGVSAALAELVTTPLAHQRRRLNGSGLVLVRPPESALGAIAAAAPALGARLATRGAAWSMRLVSW